MIEYTAAPIAFLRVVAVHKTFWASASLLEPDEHSPDELESRSVELC